MDAWLGFKGILSK